MDLCKALDLLGRDPLARAAKSQDEVRRLIDLAVQLEGLPRNSSTHAAGVVIGDRPLAQLVPLYRDPRSDMPVTQFDMKYVEDSGLVKFDFLGLKTLSVLRKAVVKASLGAGEQAFLRRQITTRASIGKQLFTGAHSMLGDRSLLDGEDANADDLVRRRTELADRLGARVRRRAELRRMTLADTAPDLVGGPGTTATTAPELVRSEGERARGEVRY